MEGKGYTMLLDAVLALMLVIAFIGFSRVLPFESEASTQTSGIAKVQSLQRADDVFTTMINTGYIWQVIDANGVSDSTINEIYAKMAEILPNNTDFRIVIRKYDANFTECRRLRTFDACFPDENVAERIAGDEPPSGSEVVHGRKVFVKKEPQGDCEVIAGLAPRVRGHYERNTTAYLEGEGMSLNLGTSVLPGGTLECDETVTVHPSMNAVGGAGRASAVGVVVVDISELQKKWNVTDTGFSMSGSCPRTPAWGMLGTFQNTTTNSFRLSIGCPAGGLRVTSPLGTVYTGAIVDVLSPTLTGTWTVECQASQAQTCSVTKKITGGDAAKIVINNFINTAQWKYPGPAGPDAAGFIKFNNIPAYSVPITTNEATIPPVVSNIVWGDFSNNPDIAGAINMATAYLSAPAYAGYVKFIVMATNAHSGNKANSVAAAANFASVTGGSFYGAGTGNDADMDEICATAHATPDGNCWLATDSGTFSTIRDFINLALEELKIKGNYIDNTIVTIPVPPGQIVTDTGGGTLHIGGASCITGDANCLTFDLNHFQVGEVWSTDYSVVFPCNDPHTCQKNWQVFPEDGTTISYVDIDQVPGVLHWLDANVTRDFDWRDLNIGILKGTVAGPNDIYLDVNVWNRGHLDSTATDVKFYLNSTGADGIYLGKKDVSALCGPLNGPCGIQSSQAFYDVPLAAEGYIYAVVNKDGSCPECAGNNEAVIKCYGGAKTQYFTLDGWFWYGAAHPEAAGG